MQHLEAVSRSEHSPRLNTLLKNVLYSNFRSGSESIKGFLEDKFSVGRINTGRIHTADGYIHQLELVRQVKNPSNEEFVAILDFCMWTLEKMLTEGQKKGGTQVTLRR